MPNLTHAFSPSKFLQQKPCRCSRRIASALVIGTILSAGAVPTPTAFADSAANLTNALTQARAGSSCGALRDNPTAEKVAERFNQMTDDWLNHTGTQVPPEDPLPGLKILGYGGNKATAIQGAGKNEANAIKGAILEGYKKIPDCSYTDYGASMMFNARTGYYLSAVVMAGA